VHSRTDGRERAACNFLGALAAVQVLRRECLGRRRPFLNVIRRIEGCSERTVHPSTSSGINARTIWVIQITVIPNAVQPSRESTELACSESFAAGENDHCGQVPYGDSIERAYDPLCWKQKQLGCRSSFFKLLLNLLARSMAGSVCFSAYLTKGASAAKCLAQFHHAGWSSVRTVATPSYAMQEQRQEMGAGLYAKTVERASLCWILARLPSGV